MADLFAENGISPPAGSSPRAQGRDLFAEEGITPTPAYIPTQPRQFGGKERAYIEATGETVEMPAGSGAYFAQIARDGTFDAPPPGSESSVWEETAAMVDKQAAFVALAAYSVNAVGASEISDFVADRSRALKAAQQRQPEYMRRFNKEFDEANGVFAAVGVILDNQPAIGRTVITQAPNAIIPLMSSYLAAKGTAVVGGAGAGAVGTAIGGPALGAPAAVGGAIVGGGVGLFSGAVAGGSVVEIGSQIDEMLSEKGYDMSNGADVYRALTNPELMEEIKEKAIRKGLTTAAVDGLFAVVGGKFTANMVRRFGKVPGHAAGVAFESIGEGVSEAAGQAAREQDLSAIDGKEVIMEVVAGLGQSVGQTAIGASVSGAKKTGEVVTQAVQDRREARAVEQEITDGRVAESEAREMAAQADIPGVPQEKVLSALDDYLAGKEPDVTQFEEAQAEALQSFLDRVEPIRERAVKGRVRRLDAAIDAKLTEIDLAEVELAQRREEGRGTVRLERRVQKMAEEWETMDAERGDLLSGNSAIEAGSEVTVTDLGRPERRSAVRSLRAINTAFRQARISAARDATEVQKTVADALQNSGLSKEDQASFMSTIRDIRDVRQLRRKLPSLQKRVGEKIEASSKKAAIADVRKLLRRVEKSNVIAVDYVQAIRDLADAVDTTKRSAKTLDELRASLDHMERTGAQLPAKVRSRLKILDKKRVEDVTAAEMEGIADSIRDMIGMGRTKWKLMKAREARKQQHRLEELRAGAKPLWNAPVLTAPIGERLDRLDRVKNKFTEARNVAQRLGIYKNQMDVIFDIQDGAADYKGPTHRIFKQTIDTSFGRYLDLVQSAQKDVRDLSKTLDLKPEQYDRVMVYAAVQQEGGIDHLKGNGITEAQARAITLTPDEMRMYTLMREKMDAMAPMIEEVMRLNYNKEFVKVDNYFSFMTDFDAMDAKAIQDMFGEDTPKVSGKSAKRKNVEKGFTKGRVGGATPIKLNALDVFLKHTDNAAYLVAMGPEIRALSDLARTDDYLNIAGDLGQAVAVDWLDMLARKGKMPGRIPILDTMRKNTSFAALGFKLSSFIIQWTAIGDGMGFVGPSYVARGLRAFATSREWRQFLKDNLPEVRERAGDDPAYMELDGGWAGKVQKAGMIPLQALDVRTASSVAAGAYIKSVESRGGTVDLSNPDPIAIQEAQLAMRRSQSSGFAKDAAPIISQGKFSGNSSLDRLIFQFQSFILNRWSLIEHDMFRAGIMKGNIKQGLNLALFLTLATVVENGMRVWTKELVSALFGVEPPDDKKEESALARAADEVVSLAPYVGQVAGAFGYGSIPVPSLSLIERTLDAYQWAQRSKKEETKAKHYTSAAIYGSGLLFGIPGALQGQQLMSLYFRSQDEKKQRRSSSRTDF